MRDPPSHLDRIVTGEALLPLLVTDNDEGPAVLIERHRSRYSSHFDNLAETRSGSIISLTTRLSSLTSIFPTIADTCATRDPRCNRKT